MAGSDPKSPEAPSGASGGDEGRRRHVLGEPGDTLPAAEASLSLSQAVLAPLDAVLKAQIHAARSFLNLVLQLGYPHAVVDEHGNARPDLTPDGRPRELPYTMDFPNEVVVNGQRRRQIVTVPALALVPVAPLAVQSAEFSFDLAVVEIARHKQIQASERDKTVVERQRGEAAREELGAASPATFDESRRPWFLVDQPVSIRGAIAPPAAVEERSAQRTKSTTIHVAVKVGTAPMPAGLSRLLTGLTQLSQITEAPRNGAEDGASQGDAAQT